MDTIKLKINKPLNGKNPGETITLPALDGLPRDLYWAERIKDSEIDNCVEVVSQSTGFEIPKEEAPKEEFKREKKKEKKSEKVS